MSQAQQQAEAHAVIAAHEADVRPLSHAANVAWWNANVSGRDTDFQAKEAAQNQLDRALANPERFAQLRTLEQSGALTGDAARQVHLLYLAYLEKQTDAELLQAMSKKSNAIEQTFNVYRPTLSGKPVTDNDLVQLLATTRDGALAKQAWEASKGVGPKVASDLVALAKLRNQAAKALGFANYHAMQLALQEQDQAEVLALFDGLDSLTRQSYAALKTDLDARLAAKFNLAVNDLRPWHYGDLFFQESPAVFGVDADSVYQHVDLVAVAQKFYAGIGLPIDDVLARSDLYEKAGKSQHAFCTDLDRNGDVRVLLNLRPTEKWASTLLHELGHAVYSSKNIPAHVPYLLRTEAHILTTEGVAMMFERLTTQVDWLQAMGVQVPNAAAYGAAEQHKLRAHLLIFSRWCQVMLRFEVALYENPDQDLNTLWWDLVEHYQMVRRPDGRHSPDYAAKIHIVSAPCYYHNYMMGQLFASQLHHTLAKQVQNLPPGQAIYVGDPQVGAFMRDKVFAPGARLPYNELTRFATGEALHAGAFAADFNASVLPPAGPR